MPLKSEVCTNAAQKDLAMYSIHVSRHFKQRSQTTDDFSCRVATVVIRTDRSAVIETRTQVHSQAVAGANGIVYE